MSIDDPLTRWRLVLGSSCDSTLCLGGGALGGDDLACDAALSWLYDRDEALGERDIRERSAGLGPSQLTVPGWLDQVHRLFPKETIERLERDAVERYQI